MCPVETQKDTPGPSPGHWAQELYAVLRSLHFTLEGFMSPEGFYAVERGIKFGFHIWRYPWRMLFAFLNKMHRLPSEHELFSSFIDMYLRRSLFSNQHLILLSRNSASILWSKLRLTVSYPKPMWLAVCSSQTSGSSSVILVPKGVGIHPNSTVSSVQGSHYFKIMINHLSKSEILLNLYLSPFRAPESPWWCILEHWS